MAIIGDITKPTKDEIKELKWFLRMALTNYESQDRLTMTERHAYDCTGLKLRDRFVSYLEVLLAFSRLPSFDQAMIFMNLCLGISQEKIAERFGVHRVTVNRRIQAAYREMIDYIWDG